MIRFLRDAFDAWRFQRCYRFIISRRSKSEARRILEEIRGELLSDERDRVWQKFMETDISGIMRRDREQQRRVEEIEERLDKILGDYNRTQQSTGKVSIGVDPGTGRDGSGVAVYFLDQDGKLLFMDQEREAKERKK